MFKIARRSFTIGKLVSPAVCRSGYYCVPRFYSTTTSTDTETKELVLSNPNDFALASESPARFVSKKQGEGTFNFRLIGDESQSLEVILEPGQKIRGEVGSMIFMGPGVEMDTAMHGGFGSALGRSLTGESFFMSDFINKGEKPTKVKFGANYPSKVIPLNLSTHGGKLVAQKGAFLVGDADISIAMHTTVNLKTGFFGGEGFILQELSGSGQVFVKGGGSVTRMKLEEGEKIRVSPGSLIAFESTVKYDSEMMQGFKNIAFGGEGLFLATLEGPGVVWIQSLPFSKFMSEIASAASSRGGLGFGVPLGGGGGHSGGEEGAEEGAAEAPTEGAGEEGTMEDADSFSNDDSFGSATGSTEQSSSGSWIGGQWFGTSGESQETGSGGDGDGDGGSWFGGFFDSD